MPLTVGKALQQVNRILRQWSESAWLDAHTLLAHLVEKPHAWVLAHPEAQLSAEQEETLKGYLARLATGEPLPYLLGHWEFYGLDFQITPDVLVPRPETELMVEEALVWLRKHGERRRAVDVGTGSGCIAVSLAVGCADVHVLACDVSAAALRVAQANIRRHGVGERVVCVQSDLLSAVGGVYDLICANLPYIPRAKLTDLEVAQHEPRLALDGGDEGVALIQRLARQAPHRLAPGGLLLLEIEATSASIVIPIIQKEFAGACIDLLPDLSGFDRLVRVETQPQ